MAVWCVRRGGLRPWEGGGGFVAAPPANNPSPNFSGKTEVLGGGGVQPDTPQHASYVCICWSASHQSGLCVGVSVSVSVSVCQCAPFSSFS